MLGVIAGVIGGLGAVVFREMIKINRFIFFTLILSFLSCKLCNLNLGVILLPALGGLIVGPLVFKYAPEAKGHGVPEVMEAVRLFQGKIRRRVALIKIFVSSVTIGSGGSAGREGPIAQIGAAFGSILGDLLKVGGRERKLIVVSGLSAGIAGTFNAPLGGAIFGLEVMYGGLTLTNAIAVILAAVIGAAIVEAVYGPYPAFYAPPYLTFSNPAELIFYFLLGIIFGFLAVIWIKLFYFFEDLYDKLKIGYYKTAIGGLITGILGFAFYEYGVLGVGYEGINLVLIGELSLSLLLVLGTLKMLTTANTIGSGGSGGVFAPSLYIGAMYGGALGILFNILCPSLVKHPFTYSLAGMAALFAATAHAPLSMIIMIPEMSNDYSLLLPMMAACSTSYIISRIMLGDSNIYTLKLKRKGIRILLPYDFTLFEVLEVKEFMTKDVITITPDMHLNEVYNLIKETHHDCYPVIVKNELVGVVTVDDIMGVPFHLLQKLTVKDVMRRKFRYIYSDDSIKKAIEIMYSEGIGKIIVVSKSNPRKLDGILTKTDIIKAYKYITAL